MSNETHANGPAWQVTEMGSLASWSDFAVTIPQGPTVRGKEFLRRKLGLTGMEVSLNAMPPGQSVPFVHAHKQNEELYLFLSGMGEMLLDGLVVPVGAGTAIRIEPAVVRCFRNTGDVPLTCIVVQAKAGSLQQATLADGIVDALAPRWPQ